MKWWAKCNEEKVFQNFVSQFNTIHNCDWGSDLKDAHFKVCSF